MGGLDFSCPFPDRGAYSHVDVLFDKKVANTLWVTMKKNPAQPAHHFSLPLLHELHEVGQALKAASSQWHHNGRMELVNYAVMCSGHPDYFSLGGDLRMFRACIRNHDREALFGYSRLCLEVMHEWQACASRNMSTISLVQGRALGGGFEAALSADHLIAEEHSTFGFPEIMFGLFPCTGAMSLLVRRLPVYQAQKLMTSGKVYTAYELHAMGIIDEVCGRGDGVAAVERYIAQHTRRRAARLTVRRAVERVSRLDFAELLRVVEDWVDLAMALTPNELRVMDMLISMQYGSAHAGVETDRLAPALTS